jgi:hypothetical protein
VPCWMIALCECGKGVSILWRSVVHELGVHVGEKTYFLSVGASNAPLTLHREYQCELKTLDHALCSSEKYLGSSILRSACPYVPKTCQSFCTHRSVHNSRVTCNTYSTCSDTTCWATKAKHSIKLEHKTRTTNQTQQQSHN